MRSAKHPALKQVNHRPWPLPPKKPWLSQIWQNLLFIHWEVNFDQLRAAIPKPLELDCYAGKAWIAIVPFDMKKVTINGFPSISYFSNFPEINVRTYVTLKGKPGVWFFSLDVPSKLAVWGAKTFFHLPYRHAAVQVLQKGREISYQHSMKAAAFKARYRAVEPISETTKHNTFEFWATERYCLYCQSKAGHLYRTEVQHQPWSLHRAEIDLEKNTLLNGWDIGAQHPSVLFSKHLDVLAYFPERLKI